MSAFTAEWLALREPVDAAARSRAVTDAVLSSLRHTPARIVDLGCGTGSNVRFLAPLVGPARWRLVDHDERLLEVARARLGCGVETRTADLRVLDPSLFEGADLVTASALLDLVSEAWLTAFVAQCHGAGAAVLAALSYDGRIVCWPAEPSDALVRDLVNRHQRTDKGLGPALGPDSGARAAALLREAGYEVSSAKSDWTIDTGHAELQRQLIAGWATAATELSPPDAMRIDDWAARRIAHVTAGTSRIIVGHDDVGAIPATRFAIRDSRLAISN